jgi:hypothetical protein
MLRGVSMRLVFAAITAAFFAVAQPAAAQAPAQPGAQSLSSRHIAAAQDTLRAILIDTGSLAAGSLQAFTILAPQFRAQVAATPMFAGLTPARQRALTTYIEAIGPIGQEETLRGASVVIERFAPSLAALFSESELTGIAAYLRTPEGGAYFLRSVQDGVQAEATGQQVNTQASAEETAALAAFEATPAGIAFNARSNEMAALMNEVGRASTGAPHIGVRFRRDMCALLEEQCPPGWAAP